MGGILSRFIGLITFVFPHFVEEIGIDKRLIETLDGPLTHMVRNAVDHGVETPDKRRASGKPAEGKLCVAVTETPDDVTLTISDDGKGLDIEAINNKAVNLRLIKPDQQLNQDQIVDMIFTSGVSTAEMVTEISGRGVEMDVVRDILLPKIRSASRKITRPILAK